MSTTATTPDAIDLVVGRDAHGSWVHEFSLRGKVYTLVPGGCSTFDTKGAKFRVWSAGGAMRDVRVKSSDRVEVISRAKGSNGESYPEGSAPWGDWTPSH